MKLLRACAPLAVLLLSLLPSHAESSDPVPQQAEKGMASWYGPTFQGRKTANGEIYDKEKLTAAHRTLPFGTFLRVTSLDNGSSVVVRVNDRGPFAKDRLIDLSEAAARIIGMVPTGTAMVSLQVIPRDEALAWKGGGIDGEPAPDPSKGSAQAEPEEAGAARVRIQVASYASEANARGTVERLILSGLHPAIEAAGGRYRVVFPDLSLAESRLVARRLEGLGYRGYILTTIRKVSTP